MEVLRRVGLADRAKDRVHSFSKGMRQRMMISRAFINKPKVLFLDEPTDGLDPVTSAAIRKTIKEEADRGAAVLLTTHDMFEADELSDRVAFINDGEIVALDTAENLKLKYGEALGEGAACATATACARSTSSSTATAPRRARRARGLARPA